MTTVVIKNTSAKVAFEIYVDNIVSSLSISINSVSQSSFTGEFQNGKLYSVSYNQNKVVVNNNIFELLVAFIGTIVYSTETSYSSITKMQLNDQISRAVKIFMRDADVN